MNKVIKGTLRTLNPRARRIAALAVLAFAGVFTAACSDSNGPQTASTVTISPTTATIPVGGTQQFTAVIKNSEGNVLNVAGIWAVSGGGTITSTGLFTAGSTPGTSTITVSCSGITATATVTVTAGALASIVVTPNPGTMPINTALTYTASGRDALGNTVALTAASVTWSVVNGGGTIPGGTTGLTAPFTAGSVTGTFANTVRAAQGTLSGTATAIVTAGPLATITVTPDPATMAIGAQQQFTAVGRDAGGNVVAITPVWSVDTPPGGGTINAGSGLFTAGGATGTFTDAVRATSGSIFDRATVIVTSGATPIVNLGAATSMGILAGSTITCVTGGTINADIGLSPGGAVVLGTPPCVVTGTQHITDATAAQAQSDLTVAYNALAALPCGTVVGTADIGASTRAPGVYCSASTIGVTGTLTLDGQGDPNAVFVFQAGSGLTGVGTIALINGAQAKNVYWQVGSSATIGTGSNWKGNILSLASISLNDNVTLIGRALARTAGAVTLGTGDTITLP
ncbi:MAG TPA: ice-binding family protein [Gemmatimonadaceae bacterium]|jgi:hypothetical protein|nr:ice-binding family protein [Gemmatimonadaceae bacterium]